MTLAGPIAAGNWHLIGDGIAFQSTDVQFDVLWRHGTDTPIVSWTHHFDPPAQIAAVKFDADATGAAVPAEKGDELVLRWSVPGPDGGAGALAFQPNGDGSRSNGRIPSLILPR